MSDASEYQISMAGGDGEPLNAVSVLTVADLTEEHVGWYMKINVKSETGAIFPHFHKHIELGGIRRWEYEGTAYTGLLDVSTKAPGIIGTERQFDAAAEVQLVRHVRKPRKKRTQ
ncbi:hypothetical protein [Arthrobacter sp. PsM3]|uniref:hypothetical protein n=1 Tax=Arthrobacter sp. PsM3 TaxID=3030531 RepID=UPI00263B0134|nr:hypothetical protein [Arthrobacter sp. PsM3]MDN4645377.1 hypothetical protein [Arthrobacter sp. PsM3]